MLIHILSVLFIVLVILYQHEIRAALYRLSAYMERSIAFGRYPQHAPTHTVHALTQAVTHMSAIKTGALIVITGRQKLNEYTDSGEPMDAVVSSRLIENIFFKNSPLHDGAVIIANNRIRSAACILPVSDNKQIPQQYGLRHRAALGLTEKTDATALVVSEETGEISIATGDKIRTVTPDELSTALGRLFL